MKATIRKATLALVVGSTWLCLAQRQDNIPVVRICAGDNVGPCVTKRHDQMLFDAAMKAVEQKKFDVANLTLQTLVNTYPNSEYAAKARLKLHDPPIAQCGDVRWSPKAAECNPDLAKSTPPTK